MLSERKGSSWAASPRSPLDSSEPQDARLKARTRKNFLKKTRKQKTQQVFKRKNLQNYQGCQLCTHPFVVELERFSHRATIFASVEISIAQVREKDIFWVINNGQEMLKDSFILGTRTRQRDPVLLFCFVVVILSQDTGFYVFSTPGA